MYDAAARTVALSPVRRLNLHNLFRLTVIGTGPGGVTDSFGNLLDGQKDGDPGSNFVTIVTAADLVLTTRNPAILRAWHKIVSSQASLWTDCPGGAVLHHRAAAIAALWFLTRRQDP